MFSSKVLLWGGISGAVGGFFWVMAATAPQSPSLILALVLGLGGLASLYSRQIGPDGKLGLAGFILGIIGTGLTLVSLLGPIANSSPETNPGSAAPGVLITTLGLSILGLGLVLLGIASLRAKTLPRWRSLPLGLGLLNIMMGITIWLLIQIPMSRGEKLPWPGPFLPVFVEFALLGLGWIGLGTTLAAETSAEITPSKTTA